MSFFLGDGYGLGLVLLFRDGISLGLGIVDCCGCGSWRDGGHFRNRVDLCLGFGLSFFFSDSFGLVLFLSDSVGFNFGSINRGGSDSLGIGDSVGLGLGGSNRTFVSS